MEKEQKEVTWNEVHEAGNKFLAFEQDVRTMVKISNWKIIEKEAKKYKSEELEMKLFFESEVLEVNGEPSNKILSLSSNPFLNAAKKVLSELDPKTTVTITVKRLGKDSNTNYDVELVEDKK